MVELILVRHGECYGSGKYIGKGSDVPLTSAGENQIIHLSSYLKDFSEDNPVDLLYSSPMKRCMQTSNFISNDLKIPINILSGMEETDFGDWEGLGSDEIEQNDQKQFRKWVDNPYERKPPYGESLNDLNKRVLRAFLPVSDKINDEKKWKIVLVSHRGPLSVLITNLMELDLKYFWNFKIDRGSVTILNLYPRFTELSLLNRQSQYVS